MKSLTSSRLDNKYYYRLYKEVIRINLLDNKFILLNSNSSIYYSNYLFI